MCTTTAKSSTLFLKMVSALNLELTDWLDRDPADFTALALGLQVQACTATPRVVVGVVSGPWSSCLYGDHVTDITISSCP